MSAAALDGPVRPAPAGLAAFLRRLGARLAGWTLGALLCLTPLTALLAQGWLTLRMRRLASTETPPAPSSALRSGVDLLRISVSASAALVLGLLPFTALMLFSWWGGWENSFGKGYEQAWIGPSLGLLAVLIALPLLARAPLALVHLAVERRFSAFFESRAVGRIMRHAGWEHLALAAAFVVAAAPLFAVTKGLPVFIEQIRPGFEDLSPEAQRRFAFVWRLAAGFYLFGALWLLRGWSARLYVKARRRAEAASPAPHGLWGLLGAGARRILLWALWFGLIAQIYLGQFLNMDWAAWLNPPLVGIPLVPSLGG